MVNLYNLISRYNLAILERLTNNYEKVSSKIKQVADYLNTKDKTLEGQLLLDEAIYECDHRNYKNVKNILLSKTMITHDTLVKYCKILSYYVEKINNKNACLKKTMINSSNKSSIQYKSLVEKLNNYSANLFGKVEKVSNIINKNHIIPAPVPSVSLTTGP